MMQLFFEMFGLLLPPPRVWRALARAEMRVRAAAATRAFRRPRGRAWLMSHVLCAAVCVDSRPLARMACSM